MLSFWILAVVAVVSALMVVTRPNPMHSALWLLVTFFSLAGVYLLLNAEFVAAIQIIIYAGAILVLFLFVVLSLDPKESRGVLRSPPVRGASAVVVILLTLQLVYALRQSKVAQSPLTLSSGAGDVEHVAALGRELFTAYLVPFEIGSVLLLVAVLGAVVLAHRKGKSS